MGKSVDGSGVTVSTLGCLGVDGGTFIGDLSDESVVVVSGVGGGLDSAVGKGDGERSGYVALSILGLGLLEVSLAVVISNTVLIGIGLRGKLLNGSVIRGGGTIGWGSSGGNSGYESRGEDNLNKINIKIFIKRY